MILIEYWISHIYQPWYDFNSTIDHQLELEIDSWASQLHIAQTLKVHGEQLPLTTRKKRETNIKHLRQCWRERFFDLLSQWTLKKKFELYFPY